MIIQIFYNQYSQIQIPNNIEKQMISFGDTKNNIQKLKSYLTKMQFFSTTGQKISPKQLEQQNFRQANNQLFLPLMNYILIQYSTDIFIKAMDYAPNLRLLPDKGFIESIFNIGRKMLNMDINLTPEQFLTNKYFQKKLQFVANLAKCVFERAEALKKIKNKQPTLVFDTKLESSQRNKVQKNQYMSMANPIKVNTDNFDDFEQQFPIQAKAIPAMINIDELASNYRSKNTNKLKQNKEINKVGSNGMKIKNSNASNHSNKGDRFVVEGEQFGYEELKSALEERNPTPVQGNNQRTRRPIEQPMAVSDRFRRNQYPHQQKDNEEQDAYDRFRLHQTKTLSKSRNQDKTNAQTKPTTLNKTKKTTQQNQSLHYPTPASIHQNCVGKQQFNQLVQLVKVVSQAVNQISQKFIDLQDNISGQLNNMNGQINNLNAKILILENNVQVIKDNL